MGEPEAQHVVAQKQLLKGYVIARTQPLKQGRIDEARQLLTVTASDLGQAGWLLTYANDLLKGLPQ